PCICFSLYSFLYYTTFFFFNAPPTPDIYTLSLHDALPIYINKMKFYKHTLAMNHSDRVNEKSSTKSCNIKIRYPLCRQVGENRSAIKYPASYSRESHSSSPPW